ncbi:MAG: glutamate--tRNA ligase [Syntrophomonadaceae bacterium]|nr:glutamate--tRNA ligase [Syntrophomonadaceae bacterium]
MYSNHKTQVRVRFAPSPTGPLHIGGARSALFNYLFARKHRGTFIVRMEDTDLERSNPESEADILNSLRWLGLDWDEGVDVGGPCGPYRQTDRVSTYRPYVLRLLSEGKAYPCYCTEEELEAERQLLLARGEMPRYLGRCSRLTEEEREARAREGRKAAIRFRVPPRQMVVVDDLVRGRVTFDTENMGDFIIIKSDGIPVYNFAVVIDDHLMRITHVLRGEEHLSNTPRQILLYQALGLTPPSFAHISLILGPDRTKMSKRHGATSIVAYQRAGFLPEALVNFLALLGWSPPGEQEILSLGELVELFSLDRVAKNPAVFDADKLRWINGSYIRQSPPERLAQLALPFLKESGIIGEPVSPAAWRWVLLLAEATRERLSSMAEIVEEGRVFAGGPVEPENSEAAAILREETVPRLMRAFRQLVAAGEEIDVAGARELLKRLSRETRLSGRRLFMPLRVALTGRTHGVELYYAIPLLGREGCLARTREWDG